MAQASHQARMQEVWGPQWFLSRGWEGACVCGREALGGAGLGARSLFGLHIKSRWLCPELSQGTLMGGLMAGK